MKIQIKHKHSGVVLFETEAETLVAAVVTAVKTGANLSDANLRGADLIRANLSDAYLRGADLRGANLSGADLIDADLSGANLSDAYLRGADLRDANLRRADLSDAKIPDNELAKMLSTRTIVPDEGDFIGWKKLSGGRICKLKIPANAKRIGGLLGRKCRAEFVEVLEGEGYTSIYGPYTAYKPGKTVHPDSFDPDPRIECSHGIHFFITRIESEEH